MTFTNTLVEAVADVGSDAYRKIAVLETTNARFEAALQRILRLNGSTGGPAALVREFKFIAEQALMSVK